MENKLSLLPPRPRSAKKDRFEPCKFLTNFFEIAIDQKVSLYQFSLHSEPEILDDSREILYDVVVGVKKHLKKSIDLVAFKGKTLWGSKNLNVALPLTVEVNKISYQLLIKPAKELVSTTFDKSNENKLMLMQMYNITLHQALRKLGMVQLSRGKYYKKQDIASSNFIKDIGLQVIRGFAFTLCPLRRGITLQVDVCTRVVRIGNFLETINKCKSKDEVLSYKGSIVLTRYGIYRTYKIQDICFDLKPTSQFYQEKKQGMTTYEKYYEESYNIKILDKKQPLIEVIIKQEKIKEKGQVIVKATRGYLIPELVSLTGIPDEIKSDFHRMRELAKYTQIPPKKRIELSNELKGQVNGSKDIFTIQDPIKVQGFILPEVTIKLKDQQLKSQFGSLNIRNTLKEPMRLQKQKWLMVYSSVNEQKAEDDNKEVDEVFELFQTAGKTFGMQIEEPVFVVIEKNGIQEWKNKLSQNHQKNDVIVVVFLHNYQSKLYPELKVFLLNTLKITSQFILRKTLRSAKPMPAASKIVCQMSAKIGRTLWEVSRQHEFWKGKSVAYGALSISKGASKHTISFVGTTNLQLSKIYSDCKTGIQSKESIPQQVLEDFFSSWIKAYRAVEESLPQIIILYREGLSEPQIQAQSQTEIDAVHSVIVRARKVKENYRPQFLYVVVNKRINAKFYVEIKAESSGKFQPNFENPNPGSIIFEELSSNDSYDFHLAAQKATQGTCTPTHYRIAYDQSSIPQEAIAQFTYEQCYNYYNWTGSVRVPACLQCAGKLSKLVGEGLKVGVEKGNDLQKTFYFL